MFAKHAPPRAARCVSAMLFLMRRSAVAKAPWTRGSIISMVAKLSRRTSGCESQQSDIERSGLSFHISVFGFSISYSLPLRVAEQPSDIAQEYGFLTMDSVRGLKFEAVSRFYKSGRGACVRVCVSPVPLRAI